MKSLNITVLGAGNMGTAIAQVIAQNGHNVKLWNYEGDVKIDCDNVIDVHDGNNDV